jgi:predicted dehydrogenase/threonine dehydrogenase-like Zn-dependent dehydrogenase
VKQVIQSLKTGETELVEVPCPAVRAQHLLVRSRATLVSAGTEKMLVDFGRSGLVKKARSQPDKVRQVMEKARTDGVLATLDAVRSKLDQPLPMGYCNAGEVLEVGAGVQGFAPGDRVVSNGGHAEVVRVPRNLCARIPDPVTDEEAAFTVLGAIALQGLRLANPTLGEAFVVTGLGLIGQLTTQLLRASGCRVLGIDFDENKLALARGFGAETVNLSRGEDPVEAARVFSRGRGVDGVLITASTSSSEPIHQAALMCRKRGRIVLVGVAGLELSRADFFEKELTFQVSCSYGPGRYDPRYEEEGQDYPVGFVRWTEQRNFEAVLDMMASGALDVKPLITHRFPVERAAEAYALLSDGVPSIGIVLDYPRHESESAARARTVALPSAPQRTAANGRAAIGVIGAGNYAGRVLIPAFAAAGVRLRTVATSGGVAGVHFGRKHGFEQATTDTAALIADPELDTVVIATRHDSHAALTARALAAGKHVFVEKPLALTLEEVDAVERSCTGSDGGRSPLLMVGFNRRFAPHVVQMKKLLSGVREPASFIVTVNAGEVPPEHWTQDTDAGGGRIVGEGCHFVDLLRFLSDSPIVGFDATAVGAGPGVRDDRATFTLRFENGSFGTVHYLANGHKAFPKERIEVFVAGRVLQLDNFRTLTGWGWPGFRRMRLLGQDKGNEACAAAFVRAVETGGAAPIPLDELLEVSRVSVRIARALRP